jgi:hypothetical protein
VEHLHGSMLHGYELKVGYGKAVPIPPQPVYPRPSHIQQLHHNMAAAAGNVVTGGRKTWGRGEADERVMHRVCF